MLVDHLIYWLKKCQIGGERDSAGNVYFGVDASIIRQTVGLLKEHRDYLTYRTREKAEDARRRQVGSEDNIALATGEFVKGDKGDR